MRTPKMMKGFRDFRTTLVLEAKGKKSYNTVALNINFNSEKGFQKYKFQWVQVESEIKTFFLKQS